MLKFLYLLFASLLGNSVARVLTGAGMALVSFAALMPVVVGALGAASSAIGGIPGDILDVANLSGVGECLSILGSAILTRTAIVSATMGVKKAAATGAVTP